MTKYDDELLAQKIQEQKNAIIFARQTIEWHTNAMQEAEQFIAILESILPSMKGEFGQNAE